MVFKIIMKKQLKNLKNPLVQKSIELVLEEYQSKNYPMNNQIVF